MQVKELPETAIIVALATFTWASVTNGAVYRVVKSFPAPTGTQPNGLAWDGRHLWMSSYMRNGGIYKLDPEDGSVLGTFTPPVAPSDGYGGLTFDGTYLWHTTFYSGLMDKLALPDLVVVSRIPCPESSPSDLAWDGSSLWTCDGGHSPHLYKVDPGTGEVLLQFDVPGTGQSQLAGLAYSGLDGEPGCLWLSWRSEIFKIDPTDGHIIASMPAPCTRAENLAWDSSYLWVASFDQGIIYQMEIAQPTGRIIYVDDDASGTNNGLSWNSSYKYLQDALEEAQYGNEIRVAQGIYKPDRELVSGRSVRVVASGDRTATFQLKNGVDIKGGYAGDSESDPDARDINLYKTILSGDLNGDDRPDFTNYSENSYHVVTGSGTNETAVLDGFTITAGNANGSSPHDHGGGIFNSAGSPTVINCTFSKNSALQHGGGMDNSDSHPKLTNCTFIGNAVELKYGGGIRNYNSTPTLINCIFIGNSGESQGGGMFNHNHSDASLINCTFSANTAADSGGIGNALESNPTLTNCIVWGNLAIGEFDESAQIKGGTPVINYCCIMGWTGILGGKGNHGFDPLFVDADGLDNIPGTEDDNLRLRSGSPCIDTGDNSAIPEFALTDLDGNPRFTNGTVDLGAYEKLPTSNAYYIDAINGDDNNDGLTLQTAFATIQKGIDKAVDGESIRVYPGLYQEKINFMGKRLKVDGIVTSPYGAPVIQNPGDYAVSFYSGEDFDSVLRNFIISDSFMGVFIAGSSPTIYNLTIVNNKYGIEAYAGSEPDIDNVILWNNTDDDLFGCEAHYSCIQRENGGEGNISSDPLFVDLDNGDYHLRSERGRYWPEHDIWVLDKITSPCIDGGAPNIYIADEPMPNGDIINIGAYGGTIEASLSPLCIFTKYSGGTGEPNDPYQIATANDLMQLGENREDYDKHFILTADIDLDPTLSGLKVFDKAVIAPDRVPDMYGPFDGKPFVGAFDGNDHTIFHLTITGESYLGLFGQLGPEAVISNIGLEAVDINGIGIFIGGLVGYNNGSITKCHSTGTVSGAYGVGGLMSYSNGCITSCYSSGTVNGSTDVGGLVGFNAGIVTSSHCNETVTGDENVGGLVGFNTSVNLGDATITNSYSTGSVFGRRACIGGLVGRNTRGNITMSYSSCAVSGTSFIGGLVGWNTKGGIITSCFWDVETSGKSSSDGGTSKTTAEMQTRDTFLEAGWDFIDETENDTENIWWILEGQGYPRLYWEPFDDGQTRTNILYVDAVNGNDNNDGLTLETAFATIQKGIDAALDGEAVLVYPGLYLEEVNFLGKSITVQGIAVSPADVPILWNPGDFAVSFYSGESPDSILKNFIIRDSFMGVFIADGSPTLNNLTIVGNKYGIETYADSEPDISNCILWDNTDGDLFGCRVRYSCIERANEGEGNISTDPLFVDPDNGDYHIRSKRGRYWPQFDIWVLDKVTSPCVDGGDPDADILDEPMPHGGRINIGAYGGTTEASLSPNVQPLPLSGKASNPYPADGAVNVEGPLTFTWTAGLNAVSHYIYFGSDKDAVENADTTDSTGIYRGYQASTSYTPPEGIRLSSTPYYWRIDEIDSQGNTIKGNVWTFTTIAPPPPKGRTCFLPETPVFVEGRLVQIQNVTASWVIDSVKEHEGTFICHDIVLESGNTISVAENHYFLTESGQWISLKELKAGIKLKTSKNSIGIISVTERPLPYVGKVYNLNIAGSDRYPVGKDEIIARDY